MKGIFVLLLVGVTLQAALGWVKPPERIPDRGGESRLSGSKHWKHSGEGRGKGKNDKVINNWSSGRDLKNFKVDVPGFYMPGVEIHGFMEDGWFPDFGTNNGAEGFVVGHTKFKPAGTFSSFKVVKGVGGFTVNGQFVPLNKMRGVFEYYIYNRIQDRLKITGLPQIRINYGEGVPAFYVENIEIPGFAKDGLFPAYRFAHNKQEAGFEIDGKWVSVTKFPGAQPTGRRVRFELNGLKVNYEDLKLKLDAYFKQGGSIEKLTLKGFKVQKRSVGATLDGFVIPGLSIPGFAIGGRFPSIKYEGRTPGFVISGQFVPGTMFPAFEIKDSVPGLIVNGKWYPYDAHLKKYLLSLGPSFKGLEIPGFDIQVTGGPATERVTTEKPDIIIPGWLGHVVIGGIPGFMIDRKFVPGWKIPGFQLSGGQPGFVIDGVFWDIKKLEKELPNFQLPSLTLPEIDFPSYTVKPIPGGGTITGITVKGFFIPGSELPGFQVLNYQPGLNIKGKFTPITQIGIEFPGLKISPKSDKYPDLVFPGVVEKDGKKHLKIEERLIPVNLIPGYKTLSDGTPSIKINGEYVPIYRIPIQHPTYQITVPAAEWPQVKIPGFEIRAGIPGFTIKGTWVPATELRGFNLRLGIPGFVIKGKWVPLDKVPADFKLPEPLPQFYVEGKIPGLILNGKFVPGDKIPGFVIKAGVPGFTIKGSFHPLTNLPDEFEIPKVEPATVNVLPLFVIQGGIPGLIVKGKFFPGDHFPGFTIKANVPGFTIEGKFVPLAKVDPAKIPEPKEPEEPKEVPVYVIKGNIPGIIINGGFIPVSKLPDFKLEGKIPGITINGKWTPLEKVPNEFKWPEPQQQTTLSVVINGNVPGIILHGKFTPVDKIPGYTVVGTVPGIVVQGKFTPLEDLTEDNVPRPVPAGVINFIIKNGIPGITVNEKFVPADKLNGWTMKGNVPGITVNGVFHNLIDVLNGKHPDVTLSFIDELPKPKFPEFIMKGDVPGLLINGEFVDGDYVKDFFMVDVDVDGVEDPVFYIDRKYVPIKEVPVKYPNYQIVVLNQRKSELIPRYEVREGIPGLVLGGKFYPTSWITDFTEVNKEPGFNVLVKPTDKDKTFVPLKELPFKVPGYTIGIVRPPVKVEINPTVYNGKFGFVINDIFYPASKIPGVTVTGDWPQVEVPVVIPGYPGEKPKFTVKDFIPGFIVKKDTFIPLKDVPGVVFVGPDMVIVTGPKPVVVPVFTKPNKLPTFEFTYGIPGVELTNIPGERPTESPLLEETTTTPAPPKPVVPDYVVLNKVPGLIINGKFVPGSSIINFKVDAGIPGFVVKGEFVPLIQLPDKYPDFVIQVRTGVFPEFRIKNGKPGLLISNKFYPSDWIKDFVVKNNEPYFTIKGKDVPLNEVPDNYRFTIQMPDNFKIVPTIGYGEIGFIINNLFYPGSKIPGVKVTGDWPKVEVPGAKVPGHESETPTFTVKDFVPGFLLKDGSFVPLTQVPGVQINGLQITIPGAQLPSIQFPGFEFTQGYPGITLDIPNEDVKPVEISTTTPKPPDSDSPPGWPRFIVRDEVPGLLFDKKFVPGDRIHRFTVKDGKPGFTVDGKFVLYKNLPTEKPDFPLTILPENWPKYTVQNKVPGLTMDGRFVPGKYIQDFTVKNDVPGFDIKGQFVPLDDLLDKAPTYTITMKDITVKTTVTIYDGEIGFIVDDKFYPGSKIPGIKVGGQWPKVQVPGLKIPGFEKVTPTFTIENWVPGFIVPGNPFIPAKNVPGVVFDGVTIILPGAQIPTIQFPGFEFSLGFPGVQVDVPGGGIDVKDFTTRAPTTTTRDPNAPYTSPPGLPSYVVLNGVPGLMIGDQFIPGTRIKHFKVDGKVPGFVVKGNFVPYHDLPKLTPPYQISIIPEDYPEYVVQNKKPGLKIQGKFVPAEWIKDFVIPATEEDEPGFKINGLFIPLIDLFEKSPNYQIQIEMPDIRPEVTIINGEIGFIVLDKFYPGSKIPGLQVSGDWPKVPVPGFKIPGREGETPQFTVRNFVPGFIVKPDTFIPAKDLPGVKFNGINIVLEGARIPTIQFPGFQFTLGIPGVQITDITGLDVKPTEAPQVNKPVFTVKDKVPGLVIDGTFYPGTIIQDFTVKVNEPGFIISGEFVPLSQVSEKYPTYVIKILKVPDPLVIRPEFAIVNGVIGVIVNDVFYPGNKIPGVNIAGNWPSVEIPGLKIPGHETETPVLTVKDFTIGFLVKDKFVPATEVPSVHIDGNTITIDNVNLPSIQFPGFEFTLGIPGLDIKIPDGVPITRPTSAPVTKDNLPQFKVVNNVPGLVILGRFIPGVFIKDFTVLNNKPGFIVKGKFVPLEDIPKDAPTYTIEINIEVRPTLTIQNGIIGFEVNKQFVPGNQIPGLIVEGKWPEIELPGVDIPGHENETPVFTVRDWVPGFVVKGEFIPATQVPGFNIINNVIVVPGYQGVIQFPTLDFTGIINILKPQTTPAPIKDVTPSTHFLGFDIVSGVPGFKIDGVWVPASKIPSFVMKNDQPGFKIKGRWIPLVDIEIKFPTFKIVVKGDDIQIEIPEITTPEPTGPLVHTMKPDQTTEHAGTTEGPKPQTTVVVPTKPDKTVDWSEFGKIVYNIAYKWERIRETFSDICYMAKPTTIETVLKKQIIDSNGLNKIRYFNEPFGHYIDVLINDYIPRLVLELEPCGSCIKTPVLEFIDRTLEQFCVDLRKQPLIPFVPEGMTNDLRAAIRKSYPITNGFEFLEPEKPLEALADAVKKVKREAAFEARSNGMFWRRH